MTSYQRRKEEIKKQSELREREYREFVNMKHLLLAIARGQKDHSKLLLKHFEKGLSGVYASICELEIEEIRQLIERL